MNDHDRNQADQPECGAIPPNVRGPVPCHLEPGHGGQHFSTSGCEGSEIRWGGVVVSGDQLNQAHDCGTCGPCADDHRIRQGCYDGVCCVSGDNHNQADQWASRLHAEHVREFTWMGGDHFADPVLVEECGNCQRWGRYAAAALRGEVAS